VSAGSLSHRIELFGETTDGVRLRWHDNDGSVRERALDRSAIEDLLDDVDRRYKTAAPDLGELGATLYRWLDGPTERWLSEVRRAERPVVVRIDCGERLRHLPWELIWDGGHLAVDAAHAVCPVRTASGRDSGPVTVANRPLRVLFMASSPADVEPVLDFEHEENVILEAAAGRVEVVVEESGTLEGLELTIDTFGDGYFDVLHLSGHAIAQGGNAAFVFEDELGRRHDVSADEIAEAINGRWPPLVFLSGCQTGSALGEGEVASMAETLVRAGARAVLGWALPVGDEAASVLAAELYRLLAIGSSLDHAVTSARRELHARPSPFWHLLRLYTDRSPLGPLVTPPATSGRKKLRARPVDDLFLDLTGQTKVASRDGFVGRRRSLQRCLREIRPLDPASGPQVLLLYGMGGLGKSTLAARLLERLRPTHEQQAVWVGKIDEVQVGGLTELIKVDGAAIEQINESLNKPGLSLTKRLELVLDGPLADIPCVFVFDDFENGNLDEDGAGHMANPAALEVVVAFATAIARSASSSRVLITSRYDFPLPGTVRVQRESLLGLSGPDLHKKLRLTQNLGPTSTIDPATRNHAIEVAAGIPRLIERIDLILGDDLTDTAAILDGIDAKAVEYREEILAEKLLAAQSTETRRTLALAAVYEIPVPTAAIVALDENLPIVESLLRATQVGLLESGEHPVTGELRHLVSPLLKPLVAQTSEQPDDVDMAAITAVAARTLFDLWVESDGD